MPTPHARAYWQGRIEQLRGQALDLAGKRAAAAKAHRRAITAWQTLQAMGLGPEDKAEAYIHEARSLFAIDQRAKGMDALDQAIDVQPDRKETYADVIALLTTHGNMPEALDAYHRALGRREVSEYLKSYCSFWIVGLARRAGLPPDPLAMSHLSRLKGTAWYTELAKLISGSVSYQTLLKRAKGPSNLAELYFYQADLLLARGKTDEAKELWKKVIATNMMAFYEFDMATYNLRHGAAKVSTQPIDRKQGRTDPSHATSN
jgi:tetratricopeptide (TPR) repeat protein